MRELDLPALLAVLRTHDVDFVLIGGLAAVAHGSPFPTEDVDITPLSTKDNLQRLSGALTELDAHIRTEGDSDGLPFAHDAASLAAAETWNLTTRFGDLDIAITPAGTTGYDDLLRDADAVALFGNTVLIASLADVIRSKQAANRPKDQRVLPTLRELLARTERPTLEP